MFPPEGITVFGSLLHTHLVGKKPSVPMRGSYMIITLFTILKFCFTFIAYFTMLQYINYTLETCDYLRTWTSAAAFQTE